MGCTANRPAGSVAARQRAISPRRRRAKQRHDWRAHRGGQVHRAGVASDEDVEPGEHGGERRQVDRAAHIDEACAGQTGSHRIDDLPIARRAGQHDGRAVRFGESPADGGEPIEMPLFGRPAAARVDANERACGAGQQRRGLRDRLGRRSEPGPAGAGAGDAVVVVAGRASRPTDGRSPRRDRAAGTPGVREERAAAAGGVAESPARAGQPQQEIAPDIGLEVDRDVVARRAPAARACDHRRPRLARPTARQPGGVEREDAGDRPGSVAPAAHSTIRSPDRSPPPATPRARRGSRRAPSADRRCARAGGAARAAPATARRRRRHQPSGASTASATRTSAPLTRVIDLEVVGRSSSQCGARWSPPPACQCISTLSIMTPSSRSSLGGACAWDSRPSRGAESAPVRSSAAGAADQHRPAGRDGRS